MLPQQHRLILAKRQKMASLAKLLESVDSEEFSTTRPTPRIWNVLTWVSLHKLIPLAAKALRPPDASNGPIARTMPARATLAVNFSSWKSKIYSFLTLLIGPLWTYDVDSKGVVSNQKVIGILAYSPDARKGAGNCLKISEKYVGANWFLPLSCLPRWTLVLLHTIRNCGNPNVLDHLHNI